MSRSGKRTWDTITLLLHTVCVTYVAGLSIHLSPSIVEPGGTLTINCTFGTANSDFNGLIIQDQLENTMVVFRQGAEQTHADFQDKVTDVAIRDGSASFLFHVPPCYALRTFICQLVMADGQNNKTRDSFKLQRLSQPMLYHQGECVTCNTSTTLHKLYLDVNDTTALQCQLHQVSEILKLTWSKDYILVRGSNVTTEKDCVYDHVSSATTGKLEVRWSRLNVTCSAVTSRGTYTSPLLEVIRGEEESEAAEMKPLQSKQGSSLPLILGITCAAVVVLIIAAVVFFYYKRSKENSGSAPI